MVVEKVSLYHLVLVVGVWLLKKLKILENISGFQVPLLNYHLLHMYVVRLHMSPGVRLLGLIHNVP